MGTAFQRSENSTQKDSKRTSEKSQNANCAFTEFSEERQDFIADSSPAGNKARGECDAKNPEASSYGRNVLSRVLRGARMHCMVQRSYKSPPLGEGRGCGCNPTSNTGI